MRWFLIFILLIPCASALFLHTTGQPGSNPALYGDMVAYESQGAVHVYDFGKKQEVFSAIGTHPSIFAYLLTFEQTENGLQKIKYVDIRDGVIKSTNATGTNPFVFSNTIVFSTSEFELDIDFSNDGDLDDMIIRMFHVETSKLSNLKAVGDFPVVNKQAVFFVTPEKSINVDLNADEDQKDSIVRVFDPEERKVANTLAIADSHLSASADYIAFSSQGKIAVLGTSQKVQSSDFEGSNPSISKKIIVFENDGYLYGFSPGKDNFAKIIEGTSPSLSNDQLVFVSKSGIIELVKDEDADKDAISDFIDSCPELAGSQNDSDSDGIGDGCDVDFKKKITSDENKSEEYKSVAAIQTETSSREDNMKEDSIKESKTENGSGISWYWYAVIAVVLILFAPFAFRAGLRYYKKRKKGFGF